MEILEKISKLLKEQGKKQIFYKAMPGIILNMIPTIYTFVFVLIAIQSISVCIPIMEKRLNA